MDSRRSIAGPSASSPPHSPALMHSQAPSSSPKRQARDVFETILKGRRSWKTLRDGDLVWPPELEAALLEGLESYQPDDSRETRLLGRFPRRNRFISDYILHTTGKIRTPKQVGSRLQQLRDTTGGKQLLKLLCPPRRNSPPREHFVGDYPRSPTSPLDSDYSLASDGSMPATPTTPGMPATRTSARTVVCIEVLPDCDNPSPRQSPCGCVSRSSQPIVKEPTSRQGGTISFFRPVSHARHLRCIDPTVTFTHKSSSKLSACYSYFTVLLGNNTVHTESVPLESSTTMLPDGTALYTCRLVPGYWNTICNSDTDPTQYTIYQEVANYQYGPACVLFTATYKFIYPSPSRSASTRSDSSPPVTPPLPHSSHVPSSKYQNSCFDEAALLASLPPCPPMDSMYHFSEMPNDSYYGSYPHSGTVAVGRNCHSTPAEAGRHSNFDFSHSLSGQGFPSELSNYMSS